MSDLMEHRLGNFMRKGYLSAHDAFTQLSAGAPGKAAAPRTAE
jgi:hypothetical protein